MPYRCLSPQEAQEIIKDPSRRVYRLSFLNPLGKADYVLVEAATRDAVLAWAQRDLSPQGYNHYSVGLYLGPSPMHDT